VGEVEPESTQPVEEQRLEPQDETRFSRGLRYGHRGGLYAALAVGIGIILFLVLLVARNTRQVKLDYIVGSTRAGLIWLILISAIAGWVLGIVTAALIHRRTRAPRPQVQR
jgi:uncharacterized integral membrane protein